MEYFARCGSLSGFSDLVREHGQNPFDLLAQAGLDKEVLENPDLYVSYKQLIELFLYSADRCRLRDFGLRLGLSQGVGVFGALAPLLFIQASAGEAMDLVKRNLNFHAKGGSISSTIKDDLLEIAFEYEFHHQIDCRQNYQLLIALISNCVNQLLGKVYNPVKVELTLSESYRTPLFDRAFNCPVAFNSNHNAIYFPASILAEPICLNSAERKIISESWRRNWLVTDEGRDLYEDTEKAITALLPTGECNLETVAKIVGIHPRNLQEKLKASDASYGKVLQSVRKSLANQHLTYGSTNLSNLALDLGYNDLAAFSRAFKKWFGLSPKAWQKKNNIL